MILGFKPQFVPKILNGTKIHTIRKGNRWKPGMSIQMATGVRTKNYCQFNTDISNLQICKSVQTIKIRFNHACDIWQFHIWNSNIRLYFTFSIYIDDIQIVGKSYIHLLALNDGFEDVDSFINWFYNARNLELNMYEGQIIHWTNFKY